MPMPGINKPGRQTLLVASSTAVTVGLVWYLMRRQNQAVRSNGKGRGKGRGKAQRTRSGGPKDATKTYIVVADKRSCTIGIREDADVQSTKTGFVLHPGETFRVVETVFGEAGQRYLRLEDGRGWVFTLSSKDGRVLAREATTEDLAVAVGGGGRVRRAASCGDSAAVNTIAGRAAHTAMTALAAVSAHPGASTLAVLLAALTTSRHATVACRHQGAMTIVTDAWRKCPQDPIAGALCASVLFLYSRVHGAALRRIGVEGLCLTTLASFGASCRLLPVAKLLRRIGSPTPTEVLYILQHDGWHIDCVRPLLQSLNTRKDLHELQEPSAQALLNTFLTADLLQDVMPILCKAAPSIEVPACSRGVAGDDGESDSNDEPGSGAESEDGADADMQDVDDPVAPKFSPQPRERRKSSKATTRIIADADANLLPSLLDQYEDEAAPADDGPMEEDWHAVISPKAEFLEHLAVDAEMAVMWPVIFPVECEDHELDRMRFYSSFEGGNLRRVRVDDKGDLELLLCGDTNRISYSQWFFFDVEVAAATKVRFRIVNFSKASSTLADGQRVVSKTAHCSWQRAGENCAYFPNRYAMLGSGGKQLYTFAWTMHLAKGRTRVAYFYPYLFGDFLHDFRRLHSMSTNYVQARDLGPTPNGHRLPVFTISEPLPEPASVAASLELSSALASRPHVIISARVHPGEAPASFMMRGVLEMLLADTDEARGLRSRFIFTVVPMLNPDGVALGNGRSNSAGEDLNRCWEFPTESSPEVSGVRALLEELSSSPGGILAFLDLHAHSGRHGAFTLSNPGTQELPDLLTEMGAPLFDRAQCSFTCPKFKRGSARCVAWRDFGVPHAHTVEATYAAIASRKRLAMISELTELGRCLVRACGLLPASAPTALPTRRNSAPAAGARPKGKAKARARATPRSSRSTPRDV